MKGVLLHGYIICDTDGLCQAHTLATNRADCWQKMIPNTAHIYKGFTARRRELKQQGFRCARVWVVDAEVSPWI